MLEKNNNPFFSIVIVVLNAENSVLDAVNSLVNQKFDNYELIVVDGGSVDETLNIIESVRIKNIKIISEIDDGIYDAMNKGIKKCSGEFIYFLNSDDSFYSNDVLGNVYRVIKSNRQIDLLYGDVVITGASKTYHKYPDFLNKEYFLRKTICHQAIFAKKELFSEYGLFDVEYKIFADYVWLANLVLRLKVKYLHVNQYVCYYSDDGESSKSMYWGERFKAYRKFYGAIDIFWFFLCSLGV